MKKAGIGSSAGRVGTATLGALAAVNAVGDVVGPDGTWITGAPTLQAPEVAGFRENTTLVAVATDARLSKSDLPQLGHTMSPLLTSSHVFAEEDTNS